MKRKWYILLCMLVLVSCKKLDFERVNKVSDTDITIKGSWVTASASLVDFEDAEIEAYGHCWSTRKNPTFDDSHTIHETQFEKRTFVDTLLFLKSDEIYYIRSYVKKTDEIVYGEERSFVAPDSIIVSCDTIEVVGEETIVALSSIASIGSLKIPRYGIMISQDTMNMSMGNTRIKGSLSSQIQFKETFSNLSRGEIYYVQIFAELSEQKTVYSNIVAVTVPKLVVETENFVILGAESVQLNGALSSLSYEAVSEYGFCISSTTSQPNYNDERIIVGNQGTVGEYSTTYLNVSPTRTYYYRAYAMSGNTIVYGDVKKLKIK